MPNAWQQLLQQCWHPPVDMHSQVGNSVQLVVQRCQAVDSADALMPFFAYMRLALSGKHRTCCMDGMVHTLQVQQQVWVFCVA
jgi:hypothetical protein